MKLEMDGGLSLPNPRVELIHLSGGNWNPQASWTTNRIKHERQKDPGNYETSF